MRFSLRQPFWVWLVVLAILAAATAAVSALATGSSHLVSTAKGVEKPQGMPAGCPMMSGESDTTAASGCPMQSASGSHPGYALMTGTVTAVNTKKGTVTVEMKLASTDNDPAVRALGQVKVGDTLALAVAPEKATASVPVRTSQATATQYTCPMHPEVVSDKPGRCLKCGMDLVPVKPEQK